MLRAWKAAIVAAVIFFVGACSPKKANGPADAEAFPRTVGTVWTYWAYDSLGADSDTVDVTIQEYRETSLGRAVVWNVASRDDGPIPDGLRLSPGESLVIIRSDSVLFYRSESDPGPYMVILLPLEEGNWWRIESDSWPDSTAVRDLQTVTTPYGEFSEARRLRESIGAFDCFWFYDKWFVQGVGFVKGRMRSAAHVCGQDGVSVWELISYDIPQPVDSDQ